MFVAKSVISAAISRWLRLRMGDVIYVEFISMAPDVASPMNIHSFLKTGFLFSRIVFALLISMLLTQTVDSRLVGHMKVM